MKEGHTMKNTLVIVLIVVGALTILNTGCTREPKLIEQKCSTCHKSSGVYVKKRPMLEWERLLYGMEIRGLKLTPDERRTILEILAKNYSLK
jgi:hypothetical protein